MTMSYNGKCQFLDLCCFFVPFPYQPCTADPHSVSSSSSSFPQSFRLVSFLNMSTLSPTQQVSRYSHFIQIPQAKVKGAHHQLCKYCSYGKHKKNVFLGIIPKPVDPPPNKALLGILFLFWPNSGIKNNGDQKFT